ncbi:MAG: hypothetical protein GY822_04725, partial [Deltaproteobacteria bacterium]|nr:hypothetical protein [Deltaproteobacteria bacterium]
EKRSRVAGEKRSKVAGEKRSKVAGEKRSKVAGEKRSKVAGEKRSIVGSWNRSARQSRRVAGGQATLYATFLAQDLLAVIRRSRERQKMNRSEWVAEWLSEVY